VSLEALVAAVAVLIAFGGSIIEVSDCVREPRTPMAPERLRYGSARSSGDNLNVRQAAVSGEPRCYMNRSRGRRHVPAVRGGRAGQIVEFD